MPVVDYLLNSLIKSLQKTQKSRRKKRKALKAAKARKAKKRVIKAKKAKARPVKRKKRKSGRSAKRIFHKQAKKKKTKKKSPAKSRRRKTKKPARKPVRAKKKKLPAKKETAEKSIGEVTHFFSKIKVIVIKLNSGKVRVGEKIRIKGRTTDFVQKVASLQIESVDVKEVKKGQLAGLKVVRKAKPGDQIFRIT